MPVMLSFGRKQAGEEGLSETAEILIADLTVHHRRCQVEILCKGSSDDFADWITLAFHGDDVADATLCAEAFSKRITRYGNVVLLTDAEPDDAKHPRKMPPSK